MRQVDEAVQILLTSILGAGPVHAVYLFGSAARGEMSDQSDIDLLIIMPTLSDIRPTQKNLRHIQTVSPFAVDLVWVDISTFERKKDLGGICFTAHNEGHCLFRQS